VATTPSEDSATEPEDRGYDLWMYGHEHMLRGSDNGVLVAFAALAFQQIRGGETLPHFKLGFDLLLFSVLMCAVVHFAMGNVYLGRGRRLIDRRRQTIRQSVACGLYLTVAWAAGLTQLICVLLGLLLVLVPEPPEFLHTWKLL
jgi:hypothetical protein